MKLDGQYITTTQLTEIKTPNFNPKNINSYINTQRHLYEKEHAINEDIIEDMTISQEENLITKKKRSNTTKIPKQNGTKS